MSGTYQIDGELFPTQPLSKQWSREKIGFSGTGKPIYTNYWNLQLSFSILDLGSGSSISYLMDKWLDDSLHSAVLPHPQTGFLTTFSGITIEEVSYQISDYDRDKWAGGVTLNLGHISLDLSWPIAGQPNWWF